jgi:protein involved in polysaccharide export with SLBB domain
VVRNATISVSVLEARGRTYTVTGAVNAESPYYINDNDFRLLDALVAARGVNSPTGIDTIYVIRRTKTVPARRPPPRPASRTRRRRPLAPQSNLPASMADPMPRRSTMLMQDGMTPAARQRPRPPRKPAGALPPAASSPSKAKT